MNNTTDLRINNLLKGKQISKVRAILDEHRVLIHGNESQFYITGLQSCLQGLELSDELLELVGFNETETGIFTSKYCIFELENVYYGQWKVTVEGHYLCNIAYFHDLQNLFYVTHMKELNTSSITFY